MNKIYIFGHRKPDTDSVTAAISLSHLKNELGFNTIPVILSGTNNETKFVLNHFNVEEPIFINDVKLKVKDINYKKNFFINEQDSLYDGYLKMNNDNISKIPVVNEKSEFVGIFGMKDIAREQLEGNIDYMSTTYDSIIDVLKGKSILRFDEEIKGNLLVASYRSTRIIETVELNENNILIIGDRHSVIEYALQSKVKLLILTGDSDIKEEHLELAKINKVNIIKTNYPTLHVSRIINLCNCISSLKNSRDILCIDENESISDFINLANKTKYTYYPVVDKDNKCLGIIRLSDLGEKNKKQVILVDHNTSEQSIEGIEDADILEIIDHHNIGNIGTSRPINFRNMPVGSTNTIIYQLYRENNISIPKNIAGVMLSGILSDTLLLKSPTTTPLDRDAVLTLSEIADIDYQEYGLNMIKEGASLKGKTKEEMLYNDFKIYPVNDGKMGIGIISTTNPDEVLVEQNEYISLIENISKNNDYSILILLITDVLKNGSYILYNDKSKDIIERAFEIKEINQGYYLENIVTRKLQVLPAIMNVLEKN